MENEGSTVSSVATFQGDKSCGRIIVSDGHLIVIHTGSLTNSNSHPSENTYFSKTLVFEDVVSEFSSVYFQ